MVASSVVAVSYQPIVLQGLSRIFDTCPSIILAGSSIRVEEAPDLVSRQRPNVILLDSGEADGGIGMIPKLLAAHRGIRVVVFTATQSIDHAVRALEAGATGYVSSRSPAEDLIAAILMAARGETFITPSIAAKVIAGLRTAVAAKSNRSENLNMREQQIARYLLNGRTNREIAEGLGLREKTVKHYMSVLMQKFEVRNRLELALCLRDPRGSQGQHQAFG